MVNITITSSKDVIKGISITGHANAGAYGNDLVCASVSMVGVGMLNALDIYAKDTFTYEMSEGNIRVDITEVSEANQWIMKVIKTQLEGCEESYKKYIRIRKMEVQV